MDSYVVQRRGGWKSPEELQATAKRSTAVGENEMKDEVRWIRSYVMAEDSGSLGTVCIYLATRTEAIRRRAGLPVDEIIPVADAVVVRPDRMA